MVFATRMGSERGRRADPSWRRVLSGRARGGTKESREERQEDFVVDDGEESEEGDGGGVDGFERGRELGGGGQRDDEESRGGGSDECRKSCYESLSEGQSCCSIEEGMMTSESNPESILLDVLREPKKNPPGRAELAVPFELQLPLHHGFEHGIDASSFLLNRDYFSDIDEGEEGESRSGRADVGVSNKEGRMQREEGSEGGLNGREEGRRSEEFRG